VKPGDFLLGVLDFFAILLPGCFATWLVAQYIPAPDLRVALSFGLTDATGAANPPVIALAIAFLLSSYTLGHFVFMVGGKLDPIYDRWRRRKKPVDTDVTYGAARKLQETLTPKIAAGDFTTLKWVKTYVQIKAPGARVEIDRLEADSKFFRSMVIVSLLFAAHFLFRERAPVIGGAALVMCVLSYQRFRQQRWKTTELSYATAVIVAAVAPPGGSAGDSSANKEEDG
jgi:hypothetical protein